MKILAESHSILVASVTCSILKDQLTLISDFQNELLVTTNISVKNLGNNSSYLEETS
jgi:hypothetical protein